MRSPMGMQKPSRSSSLRCLTTIGIQMWIASSKQPPVRQVQVRQAELRRLGPTDSSLPWPPKHLELPQTAATGTHHQGALCRSP